MNVLEKNDPEIFQLIKSEESYQKSTIRLIASENYTSKAVLEACGTVFQNKYSEGYPGARYYQGQVNCDGLERVAIARAKALLVLNMPMSNPILAPLQTWQSIWLLPSQEIPSWGLISAMAATLHMAPKQASPENGLTPCITASILKPA